jgi:DNA-directed RNA polymerase specialized sigma24 family protein
MDRPASESAWSDFVDVYGRAILEWLRQTGLSADEVQELVCDLMVRLTPGFHEMASAPMSPFREWLQYAVHRAWGELVEFRMDAGENGASPRLAVLLSTEAHDALLCELDAECSHRRRRLILQRLQPAVDGADWEAFSRTVLQGGTPESVATSMGCDDLAVRAAAFRVHRLLHRELGAMEKLSKSTRRPLQETANASRLT